MPTKLDSTPSRYVNEGPTSMVSLPLTIKLFEIDPRTPNHIHSHCEEEDRVKIVCRAGRKSAVKRDFQV